MKISRYIILTCLMVLSTMSFLQAQAQPYFSLDPLTSSTDLGLIDSDYSFSGTGLERINSSSDVDRPMVKTMFGDYLNTDFIAELHVERASPSFDIIFFGFGEGTDAGPPHYEPTNGFFFRAHSFNGSNGVHATGRAGSGPYLELENIGYFDQTGTTFRIEKVGDNVTLSIVGQPGASKTFSMGLLPTGMLNSTNSYIFFGNGSVGTTFISFKVFPISTVQTLTMLGGNGVVGDVDPYIDASTDGGATWGPAYLTGWHPWGFVPGTNSWVSFNPDNTVGLNSTTDYRIQFYIPSTFTNPTMTFQLKADNQGIVSINGIQVADVLGQGGGPVPDLTVATALNIGLNEITIQLIDWGGIVGLNYSVELTMESDQGFELQPAENVSNQAPVAAAGPDQSFGCVLANVDVTLNGSGSSDPDGDPLTYSWSLGGNPVSTTASFTTSLGAGSHTFTLTVDDGNGGTASDDVVVAVNADTEDPVLTLVGDNPIQTICHFGYTDRGVTVEDNCDTNPTVSMTTTVDTLTLGTYTVTYTATDTSGNTASVERTVEVINNAPVVDNAVGGMTLEFGGLLTTTVDLSTVFSDPDGHAIAFTAANSDASFASATLNGSSLILNGVDIGTTEVTITATDVCGASTDDVFTVTVDVVEDLAQTVVFATNSVKLKKEVDVSSGNVMVNNAYVDDDDDDEDDDDDDEDDDDDDEAFELKVDKEVTISSGFALKANRIQVKKDAEIESDVYYNELDNDGDIYGNEYSPISIPLFSSLPPFKSAAAGNQDVTVNKNQSVDLTPGDYGEIKVKDNGTLTFSAGVYNVKSIKLKKKAKLRMNGDSTTEVRVVETMETGKDAYIGPANGSTIVASDIIFYIAGTGSDDDDENKVKFGKKGSVFATVYAPNSKIEVKEKTGVTGALYASEVKVDKEANLTLDSFFDNSGTGSSAKQMAWSSEPEFEAVPTDFALNQNYPNPFNPSTTISYSLSDEGFVSIKVYDILGREVAALVNRTQVAGRYQIRFEATDLSAGAYLYVLEIGSYRSVKKMIYLK